MWVNPGLWQVNPLNFAAEVQHDLHPGREVFVLDSTIRNITALPGCRWEVSGAVDLATLAVDLGVGVIEIDVVHGTQPPTAKVLEMFRRLTLLTRRSTKLFGTAWATRESVDQVLDAGADGVAIGPEPFESFLECATYARSRGALIATHLNGRVEHLSPSEAAWRIQGFADLSISYVGLHDNTNSTLPEVWRHYTREICRLVPKAPAMVPHIHNNFGLGTAAAVAAVCGGADGIDVASNGVGIHGGMAALEEVVVTLEILYGVRTGIDLSRLSEYARLAATVSGVPLHPYKPLVGDWAFVAELNPFVRSVLEMRAQDKERVHPLAPSLVGNRWVIMWGENTLAESSATELKLIQLGLPRDRATVEEARRVLHRALDTKGDGVKALSEQEVDELLRVHLSSTGLT